MLLKLDKLSKAYSKCFAIENVTLSICKNDVFVLLGPSGSGKTSLLRLIAGFDRPDSGHIYISDRIVSSAHRITPPHKRDIGMVFQDLALWPNMTVFKNLDYVLSGKRIKKGERRELIHDMLSRVSLHNHHNRYPSQLSGGEKQRVALARALIANPRLVIFDEPLTSLELHLSRELRDLINDIVKNMKLTIIYVTHNREEAFHMANHMAIIRDGRLIQSGKPQELLESPANDFVEWFLHG